MPRCPRGTRKNRHTGLCESCPPGTVRARNGRCDPVVPTADPQPYPYLTLPHQSRCPPKYQRDPKPPHHCHSCNGDENAILSHVSGMCHPFVQVPPTASGACPTGTRRRKGACIRVIGNVHDPVQPIPPVPHVPTPVPAIPVDPSYPRPTYMNDAQMAEVERIISRDTGNTRHIKLLIYVLGLTYTLPNVGHILEYANKILQLIQWDELALQSNDYTLSVCKSVVILLNLFRVIPDNHKPIAYKMYSTCIQHALTATQFFPDVNSADVKIRATIPKLPTYLVDELTTRDEEDRDVSIQQIHDDLRDHGAFYRPNGEIYLIPVAFFNRSVVPLTRIRMKKYPTTMTELEDYSDIPLNLDSLANMCILIEDGASIQAYSVPKHLLQRGSDPRTPMWMYMKCKGPSHSLSIGNAQVYPNKLYLNIAKLGIPQTGYVDIDEIYTAIRDGHSVCILKPRMVDGVKLVTQIASAYLYKVPQNTVSTSHCEVGHLGGFYDVYVPRKGRYEGLHR